MNSFIRIAAVAATVVGSPAFAATAPTAADAERLFSVIVIEDTAQGKTLLQQGADAAIAGLRPDTRRSPLRFAENNNLCVAYIMKKDARRARPACEAAVAVSKRRVLGADVWRSVQQRRDHAISLTNRGVLNALVGDSTAAADDFKRAARLGRMLSEPNANLARLAERAPALARAEVTAKRAK